MCRALPVELKKNQILKFFSLCYPRDTQGFAKKLSAHSAQPFCQLQLTYKYIYLQIYIYICAKSFIINQLKCPALPVKLKNLWKKKKLKSFFLAFITPGIPLSFLKKNPPNLMQPFGQLQLTNKYIYYKHICINERRALPYRYITYIIKYQEIVIIFKLSFKSKYLPLIFITFVSFLLSHDYSFSRSKYFHLLLQRRYKESSLIG